MPDALHFVAVSLDCADPAELAEFYRRLLGGEPPTWPQPVVPAQMHLHLSPGDELDMPVTRALQLGATQAGLQPDADRWRVLIDPAGHPFCVSTITPPEAVAPD